MTRRDAALVPPSVKISVLGAYLLIMGLILTYLIFRLWPELNDQTWSRQFSFFGKQVFEIDPEARLILLVMAGGALGSYIHTATSFATLCRQ